MEVPGIRASAKDANEEGRDGAGLPKFSAARVAVALTRKMMIQKTNFMRER